MIKWELKEYEGSGRTFFVVKQTQGLNFTLLLYFAC